MKQSKAFIEYFKNIQERNGAIGYIHSCPELMECVRQIGFLPLLENTRRVLPAHGGASFRVSIRDGGGSWCSGDVLLRDDLREIGTAHRAFSAVDGVGGDEILAVANLQDDVGPAILDVLHGLGVGGFLPAEDEIARSGNLTYQPLRLDGMVDVDNFDTDVLHLHLHHPRHDTHDHDGEQDDEPRQKGIAA